MSDCLHYVELISEYIDGRLSQNEVNELMVHIEKCEQCRNRLEMMKLLASEMSDMEEDVPEGFTNSVMTKIKREKKNPLLRVISSRSFVAATAAAALFVVSIGVLSTTQGRKADSAVEAIYSADDAKIMASVMTQTVSAEESTAESDSTAESGSAVMFSTSSSSTALYSASYDAMQKKADAEPVEEESAFDSSAVNGATSALENQCRIEVPEDITGTYRMISVFEHEEQSLFDLTSETVFDIINEDYAAVTMDTSEYDEMKSKLSDINVTEYTDQNEYPNIDSESNDVLVIIYLK